jgi:hypothetical protein
MKVNRYIGSIPSCVTKAMGQFAGGVLASVERLPSRDALPHGRCHLNVQEWINEYGGRIQSGWMLCKSQGLRQAGVWAWAFHSVWVDKKGKLFDITDSGISHDDEKTVFQIDLFRNADLNEGLSYNTLLIVDNSAFAQHYGSSLGISVKAGELYWATPDLEFLVPLREHSGKYRLLGERYRQNEALLEQMYGVKCDGFGLSGAAQIHRRAFLDFSLH